MYESSKQSYCLDGITATEAGCTKGRVFNPGTQQCDSPQNVPGKLDLSKKTSWSMFSSADYDQIIWILALSAD